MSNRFAKRILVIVFVPVFLVFALCPIISAATVTVDTATVVNRGFLGVGGEYDPFNYMAEGTHQGYNDAYHQWEKLIVSRMGLKFARMWFQPDWFMKGWGVYDFNSPRMQAVYKYLDTIMAADIQVELNYGWKTSRAAQSWFCFSDPNISRASSAPQDVEGYAAGASALIHHLIKVKGYRNIKFLTGYNEPDGGDFDLPRGRYPGIASGPLTWIRPPTTWS